MKERPILFNAAMVRAILDGRKTQTRRVVKHHPSDDGNMCLVDHGDGWWPYRSDDSESPVVNGGDEIPYSCPYGQPGDRLWVRETWAKVSGDREEPDAIAYRADSENQAEVWTPSIHMPRWASRITLEVVSVRVERLQDISRGDAMAEGCPFPNMAEGDDPRKWYADLWEQINGPGSWAENPWVWVVEFRREG